MALDLARIKAICFDVDGTLSDTDDQWVNAFEHRIGPLRRLFPQQNARAFARWAIMCAESPGNLVYHLFDRIHLDDEVGRLVSAIHRRRVKKSASGFLLVAGVREMLCMLYEHYPLSVVSARDEAGTMAFLKQYGLEGYFRAYATAWTCAYTKPFPHPVQWAAEQMGVHPEECLMVGDTTVDIRAGKAAGAQTVGVLCGFGQEAELRRAGADLVLPDTAALAQILLPNARLAENPLDR